MEFYPEDNCTSEIFSFKINTGFEQYINNVCVLDSFSTTGVFFYFLNLENLITAAVMTEEAAKNNNLAVGEKCGSLSGRLDSGKTPFLQGMQLSSMAAFLIGVVLDKLNTRSVCIKRREAGGIRAVQLAVQAPV